MHVNKESCLDELLLTVVERDSMHGLSSMNVEGEVRNLGIVKNFKDNAHLSQFMPSDLAISWAHLDPEESLQCHRHPVASLIVAIEGAGYSQGDTELAFQGGDVLFIPPWNEHGFTGAEPNGLWALSIQFNDIAIFENEIDPLTTFDTEQNQLPPLSQRQLLRIERDQLMAPMTFKSQLKLDEVLPENVDFCWHKVTKHSDLFLPKPNAKRLVIACTGEGLLTEPVNKNLAAGDGFWQEFDLSVRATNDDLFWLLTIDIF